MRSRWPQFTKSMYPISNNPEHYKHRTQHPCDQSHVLASEDNALPNHIVIEHGRPLDYLSARSPIGPINNSNYSNVTFAGALATTSSSRKCRWLSSRTEHGCGSTADHWLIIGEARRRHLTQGKWDAVPPPHWPQTECSGCLWLNPRIPQHQLSNQQAEERTEVLLCLAPPS
jgi:hypothetical protein